MGQDASFPWKIVRCAPKTVFHTFLRKYWFFRRNCWIKKYSASNFGSKKVIFIFYVRWPLAARIVTPNGCVANKVRVEGTLIWGKIPFNPYFFVPKYHSSDALPAPEIFILILLQVSVCLNMENTSGQKKKKMKQQLYIREFQGLLSAAILRDRIFFFLLNRPFCLEPWDDNEKFSASEASKRRVKCVIFWCIVVAKSVWCEIWAANPLIGTRDSGSGEVPQKCVILKDLKPLENTLRN